MAQLREEERQYANREKSASDLDTLLELACDLAALFSSAKTSEQRELLKNCTDQIAVRRGVVRLFAADWLKEMESMVKDETYSPSADAFGVPQPSEAGVFNRD